MMHYGYYNYGFNPGMGIFGMVLQVAWWGLVLWALMSLFRYFSHHDHFDRDHDRALQILRERYAKGEITKKEFDAMKQDLS